MQSAWKAAEAATFQSFANCYMREIDAGSGVRHSMPAGHAECIEWSLQGEKALLRAEVLSASLCGPQHFGRVWRRALSETAWHSTEPLFALQSLLREAYHSLPGNGRSNGCETELLLRVLDSFQQMNLQLEHALAGSGNDDHFIGAEQSLIFGHWLHPTPKSRQGMTFWQQETYAPEFHGQFQLHYFAARRDDVEHASAASRNAEEIVAALAGEASSDLYLRENEMLIPMHPLQAQALLLDPDVQAMQVEGRLRSLGPAGPLFTATSSVRTVYSPDADWMLKFSLPVRITNSVRANRRHELDAGVAMAMLADRLELAKRIPSFRIIKDPAYVTLKIPGRRETGFETIFRENPFTREKGDGVVTLAALTADPLPGQASRMARLIRRVNLTEGGSLAKTSLSWFRRYLVRAVEPLIWLYDTHGIALEAHQQNSLIDVSGGYPSLSYYRDNQGFYLSERYKSALVRWVPETENIASLYFPEAEIHDRFAYYLIVNQVFSVISRMAHDGLCDEVELLRALRDSLEALSFEMRGAGRDFLRHILDKPEICTKTNFATRLLNVDELQAGNGHLLYRNMPNPLTIARVMASEDRGYHAIAS